MQPNHRSLRATLQRRRYAVMGTAAGLGLLALPLTASAVVAGVTARRSTPAVPSAEAVAQAAPTPAPVAEAPGRDPHGRRAER